MKLAINGGNKVATEPFPPSNYIGMEEKVAVNEVLDSGVLSRFLGCWDPDFYGGSRIQTLENDWANFFGVKHAIAVNSCTSGLQCAVGAIGLEPGDEVIVTPYTMSASASSIVAFNGVPVFADVEEDYFCINSADIEKKITSRTKAIMAVDLFGLPIAGQEIRSLADKHGLFVIEDVAQAPGAKYHGDYAGTLGDVGVFSLNYHKHIHCGEGGVVITDNDELAERIRLIRNHAEAVVADKGETNLVNMVGYNFRMTEIEAAIAACQLKKLPDLIQARVENCRYLESGLEEMLGITPAKVRPGCSHVYYVHPFLFDEKQVGVHRDVFVEAVKAELPVTTLRENEGPLLAAGYEKPLYKQPMYQKNIAYGTQRFPWSFNKQSNSNPYLNASCPVAEKLHGSKLFFHEMMRPGMSRSDLDKVIEAFLKVYNNLDELRK